MKRTINVKLFLNGFISFFTLVALASCANARNMDALNGRYSDFRLGMTDIEVSRIAGNKPLNCAQCATNETYLFVESYDKKSEGVELFFVNGRLYKIGFVEKSLDIDDVVRDLDAQFKTPARISKSTSYLGVMTWMNNDRIARVSYGLKTRKLEAIHFIDRGYLCDFTEEKLHKLHGVSSNIDCGAIK